MLKSPEAIDSVGPLVARAKNGNPESFGELYQILSPGMERYFRRKTGHPQDAEDLTSQTFLKAWEHFEDYDANSPDSSFVFWIRSIARHTLIDHYRTYKSKMSLEQAEEIARQTALLHHRSPVEQIVERRIAVESVAQGINRLPKKFRKVLVLKLFLGMENEEISKETGKTVGYIRVLKFRGLQKLRKDLQAKS